MNNSLQPIKENLFTKILKWFKSIFNKEEISIQAIDVSQENTKKEYMHSSNGFIDSIRIVEDDIELIKIQEKFENNQISFKDMSDEEVHQLNSLYKRQIRLLKSKIEGKKMELNMIQLRKHSNN